MDFKELYLKRRSCRFYSNEEVNEADLKLILDAGMHAPVARGAYGDLLLYSLKGEKLKFVIDKIKEKRGIDPSYGAANLVLVLHKGKKIELVNQDTGCIIENMCLMATELGLGNVFSYSVGQLIILDEEIVKYLGIKPEYTVTAGVFLGHRSSEEVKVVEHKIEVIE